MAPRAKVSSVDALDSFRANLVLYTHRARPAVEEATAEVLRTKLWLENDQRRHWEAELRRRNRELEEAQQQLFRARLSHLQETTLVPQMAVDRARRAVRDAEAKLTLLKKWSRDFENRTEPLTKQLAAFDAFLASDLVKAAAHLAQAVQTLDAYTAISLPGGAVPSGPNQPPIESPADTTATPPTPEPKLPEGEPA
jgi:hypothetical protein